MPRFGQFLEDFDPFQAYFEGSGPDLDHFRDISGALGLDLASFWGFWHIPGLFRGIWDWFRPFEGYILRTLGSILTILGLFWGLYAWFWPWIFTISSLFWAILRTLGHFDHFKAISRALDLDLANIRGFGPISGLFRGLLAQFWPF